MKTLCAASCCPCSCNGTCVILMRCAAIRVCAASRPLEADRFHHGSSASHDCREQYQLHYLVLPAVPVTPACHVSIGGLLRVPPRELKLPYSRHPCNKSFGQHATHACARAPGICSIQFPSFSPTCLDHSSIRLFGYSFMHIIICVFRGLPKGQVLRSGTCSACLLWTQMMFASSVTQWGP